VAKRPYTGPIYRFSDPHDKLAGAAEMPHRHQWIERRRPASGTWERIGYVEFHLHRVKVDATDELDISVGVTVRINPKVKG